MSQVKVVGYTQLSEEFREAYPEATNEDLVAFCARVSNPDNQANTLTSPKLIQYLIKNHHWSPFEMVSVTMEIETTRDIARQILRHRSFSFQEFSQRYADPTKMGFQFREARFQDKKNRQNSIEVDDAALQAEWRYHQEYIVKEVLRVYDWATDMGIAKEQSRVVLPEGLTSSRMYMTGSLRSFFHYIEVRDHPATQKEHRIIAREISNKIIEIYPALGPYIIFLRDANYPGESNH